MPPYERLAAALRQVLPAVYANAIGSEVSPKPDPAAIYIEADEVRFNNYSGSNRDYTMFRVQFQSKNYKTAYERSAAFIRLANRQTPKMLTEDASGFYDLDRSVHIRELTVLVF